MLVLSSRDSRCAAMSRPAPGRCYLPTDFASIGQAASYGRKSIPSKIWQSDAKPAQMVTLKILPAGDPLTARKFTPQ